MVKHPPFAVELFFFLRRRFWRGIDFEHIKEVELKEMIIVSECR